jgi:hypothetical protein
MRFFVTLIVFILAPLVALGQASQPTDVTTFTDTQAFEYFLKGLGGLKGAGALPIAVFVTQIVLFLTSRFGNLLGRWQLLTVAGVSLVTTVLAAVATGMPWATALLSGPVVAGLQVLVHQLIVQFSPAKVEADKTEKAAATA